MFYVNLSDVQLVWFPSLHFHDQNEKRALCG